MADAKWEGSVKVFGLTVSVGAVQVSIREISRDQPIGECTFGLGGAFAGQVAFGQGRFQ
jgi:hypothetical protein